MSWKHFKGTEEETGRAAVSPFSTTWPSVTSHTHHVESSRQIIRLICFFLVMRKLMIYHLKILYSDSVDGVGTYCGRLSMHTFVCALSHKHTNALI